MSETKPGTGIYEKHGKANLEQLVEVLGDLQPQCGCFGGFQFLPPPLRSWQEGAEVEEKGGFSHPEPLEGDFNGNIFLV